MNLRKLLFEVEAVEGINSPSDYPYIKLVRFMLSIINIWPHRELGVYENQKIANFRKAVHIFICVGSLITGTMFIIRHKNELSLFEVGHLYITMLMTAVIFSRITTIMFNDEYRRVAVEFLTKIHLFFYKDKSEYAMKTHKQVLLISHIFSIYLTFQMIFGLSLFNLIPMYNNYAAGRYKSGDLGNSSYEHSIYLSYPFDTSTNLYGYIVACFLHWIISYLCSTWFCMVDLFLALIVFQIWGHFKILLHNLETFPRPANKTNFIENGMRLNADMFSKDERQMVNTKLKECIVYHRDIIGYTSKISEVFGPMLAAYYAFHQTAGCLLLLECSQMTMAALMRYLPLTVIMFQQLIQLSVVFELLGSVSDKLSDSVYLLPWECMDSKDRKIVAFFLMNCKDPVHLKALGVADIGVTSMATIIKTSVSYFTFLRSV